MAAIGDFKPGCIGSHRAPPSTPDAALATTTTGAADEIGPTSVFFTGNDLHEYCQRGDPFRLGYVAGLWDLPSTAPFPAVMVQAYNLDPPDEN